MAKSIYKQHQTEEDFYSSYDSDDNESFHYKSLSIIEMESFTQKRNSIIAKHQYLKRLREIKMNNLNEKVNWSTIYYLFFFSHFAYLKHNKHNASYYPHQHQNMDTNQQHQQRTYLKNELNFNIKEIQFRIKHLTDKIVDKPLNKNKEKKEIDFPTVNWIDEPLSRIINKKLVNKNENNKYITSMILYYPKSIKEIDEIRAPPLKKKTTLHLKRRSQNKLILRSNTALKNQSGKQVIPKQHASVEQTGAVNNTPVLIINDDTIDKEKHNNRQKRETCSLLNNPKAITKFIKRYSKYEEDIEHIKNNILAYEFELINKGKEIMMDDSLNYYRHYFKYNLNQEELMKEKKNTSIINKEHVKNTQLRSENYIKAIKEMMD